LTNPTKFLCHSLHDFLVCLVPVLVFQMLDRVIPAICTLFCSFHITSLMLFIPILLTLTLPKPRLLYFFCLLPFFRAFNFDQSLFSASYSDLFPAVAVSTVVLTWSGKRKCGPWPDYWSAPSPPHTSITLHLYSVSRLPRHHCPTSTRTGRSRFPSSPRRRRRSR
jgi:hypothetical protein